MNDTRRPVLAAMLALSAAAGMSTAAVARTPPMEKCYGINRAHRNDCATGKNACAGQATRSRDPNAFVLVPKGDCRKIAGGSLSPGRRGKEQSSNSRSHNSPQD
ncbi:MAG TPA: DUF2282 domain-containing protein [Gammaproteobacteria bacterium]|nr:DUF2282 domain-containing protein [Gammaproteobacteria bacterium]